MRKIILISVLLWFTALSQAATYYVARPPAGDDGNDGSIENPFQTLNKAWTVVVAGDIVYVRGGIYTYAQIGLTVLSNKDGTALNPISILNYPNEHPIFNFINLTPTAATIGIRVEHVDYLHLKGIEIKNIKQAASGSSTNIGLYIAQDCNYCTFENINSHHIGGWGCVLYGGSNTSGTASSNNLILNCDFHHNSDRYSGRDPWGGSDGFLCNSYNLTNPSPAYNSTGNILRYCRFYWNSDDGFDNRLFNGEISYEGCWSFWNGYRPGETDLDADSETTGGNGYGMKLGSVKFAHTASVLRTVTNCLFFENRLTGIQSEWSDQGEGGYCYGANIYNNTAFDNGQYGFLCGSQVAPAVTTLRNNFSYFNANGDYVVFDSDIDTEYDASNSSGWVSRDFVAASSDLVSMSSSGADGTRQSDGSLPVLTFLHLRDDSPLVDAGTDVGLDYNGVAPDIGAYETGSDETTIPRVVTSVISDITTTTATGGGTVIDDGGESVTARGVCWSTVVNPVRTGTHTSDGTGLGAFVSSIGSLEEGETYYVRAYAVNSIGTAYGSNVIFTASDIPEPGGGRLIKHNSRLVKHNSKLIKQ
jgi:hypothetical protein